MSLPGRLWRRAPAWRLALVAAIATTGLAAMFPPHLPALHRAPPPARPAAHYLPTSEGPSAAQPANQGIVATPRSDPVRSGIIPFAGRQLPLPPGNWQELVLAKDPAPLFTQSMVLVRTDGPRLTGLLYIISPGQLSGAAGPLGPPAPCYREAAIASAILAPPANAPPQTHECWTLATVDMTGDQARASQDQVLQVGFTRIDQLGAIVPAAMLRLLYYRSDDHGWVATVLFLPDSLTPDFRRRKAWAAQSAALLHSGYDDAATAGLADPP